MAPKERKSRLIIRIFQSLHGAGNATLGQAIVPPSSMAPTTMPEQSVGGARLPAQIGGAPTMPPFPPAAQAPPTSQNLPRPGMPPSMLPTGPSTSAQLMQTHAMPPLTGVPGASAPGMPPPMNGSASNTPPIGANSHMPPLPPSSMTTGGPPTTGAGFGALQPPMPRPPSMAVTGVQPSMPYGASSTQQKMQNMTPMPNASTAPQTQSSMPGVPPMPNASVAPQMQPTVPGMPPMRSATHPTVPGMPPMPNAAHPTVPGMPPMPSATAQPTMPGMSAAPAAYSSPTSYAGASSLARDLDRMGFQDTSSPDRPINLLSEPNIHTAGPTEPISVEKRAAHATRADRK